jgi:hypothetical protein
MRARSMYEIAQLDRQVLTHVPGVAQGHNALPAPHGLASACYQIGPLEQMWRKHWLHSRCLCHADKHVATAGLLLAFEHSFVQVMAGTCCSCSSQSHLLLQHHIPRCWRCEHSRYRCDGMA